MAAAGRHRGVSAKTVRRRRDRWQAGGVPGLVPRAELARRQTQNGKRNSAVNPEE